MEDKKQKAAAERARQLALVEELMKKGVEFADPSRVDIRGTLTCGSNVFIDINALFIGDVTIGDDTVIEANNMIQDSAIGSGNRILNNCHIDGATIGSGCIVGPFARLRPGAELADNVKIGNFVEVKKSRIADGSKVPHLTYIGDSIVGNTVNIGAGTVTCNYDGANKHQTVIGDNVFIGSGVQLVAPLKVGDGATIGAGSTISKPVPAGELTVARARQTTVRGWKPPKKTSKNK